MFSIVIPIYNEALNLKKLINEIFVSLDRYKNFDVILVNDGSNDNSLDIIKDLNKKYNLILINNLIRKGQSFSITKGIQKSNNEIIITIDGDGQNNPQDIPSLLDYYLSHCIT